MQTRFRDGVCLVAARQSQWYFLWKLVNEEKCALEISLEAEEEPQIRGYMRERVKICGEWLEKLDRLKLGGAPPPQRSRQERLGFGDTPP